MILERLEPTLALSVCTLPGVFLAATVLAVNMLGDGLRDMLDPRIDKRL